MQGNSFRTGSGFGWRTNLFAEATASTLEEARKKFIKHWIITHFRMYYRKDIGVKGLI